MVKIHEIAKMFCRTKTFAIHYMCNKLVFYHIFEMKHILMVICFTLFRCLFTFQKMKNTGALWGTDKVN